MVEMLHDSVRCKSTIDIDIDIEWLTTGELWVAAKDDGGAGTQCFGAATMHWLCKQMPQPTHRKPFHSYCTATQNMR